MNRPEFDFTGLSFSELIRVITLKHEEMLKELEKWTNKINYLMSTTGIDPEKLEGLLNEFGLVNERYEYLRELLNRFSTFDYQKITAAYEEAKAEAIKRGTPNDFGYSIHFYPNGICEIQIH
jgi:hypothetical protein